MTSLFPSRFRKRPVVIEAVQWNGNAECFKPWMDELGALPIILAPLPAITIKTLEGDHLAGLGDWIVRGVQDELYPVKPEIFEQTYEAVDG